MNLSELYVVEWSEQQQAFHIQEADRMLERNLRRYFHERDPDQCDWRVVGIAESFPQAREIARTLKEGMDKPCGGL